MRNEDVKVGMRVVYNCEYDPVESDSGVVVRKCDEDLAGCWWIRWDSDGAVGWLISSGFEPEEVSQPKTSKQIRIDMMAALFTAVQQGKQIEQCDAGHWYDADIEHVCFGNVHQFRVKPKYVKTIGYKKYIQKGTNGYFISIMLEDTLVVPGETFVEWVDTEWQYTTVELS